MTDWTDMKRWYMAPETFIAFRDMKHEFEKRRELQNEMSHDEFAALFVTHRKRVMDVLVDAELALEVADAREAEVPAQ